MSTFLFVPEPSDGIARRIADFLDFRAQVSPRAWTRYEEIAEIVLRLEHRIGAGSPLAESIREFVYRARPILAATYGRALLTNGHGARASVDGGDVFQHRMCRDVSSFGRTFARIFETRLLVSYGRLDERTEPAAAAYLALLDRKLPEMIADVAIVCRELPGEPQRATVTVRQIET
jgi:hypothetical protein